MNIPTWSQELDDSTEILYLFPIQPEFPAVMDSLFSNIYKNFRWNQWQLIMEGLGICPI